MLSKVISVDDLSRDDVLQIIRRARGLAGSGFVCSNLFSRTGVLLFTQPSTRTLASFYRAMKYLSMDVLVLNHSAMEKGESLKRTLETLATLEYDVAVVRDEQLDSDEGTDYPLSVISAGAQDEHPTQALGDLAALSKVFGNLERVRINFRGDVERSRVVRSSATIFERFGAEVIYNGPLKECDVVYQVRQQVEKGRVLSDDEYRHLFGINAMDVQACPKIKAVLHAGPVMVDVEIAQDLLDSPISLVSEQVRHCMYARISLLESMLVEHDAEDDSDKGSGGSVRGGDGIQVLRETPSWRPISMAGH